MNDELPKELPPELFDEDNWVVRGEIYQCYNVQTNMDTNETFLSLRTLSENRELIAPQPLAGYASWRFKIDDYTKLN